MKMVFFLVVLVFLVLFLGCVVLVGGGLDSYYGVDWEDREFNNCKYIVNFEIGIIYESVLRKMGVVDFNELFEK